jgi:acyl dehydratase
MPVRTLESTPSLPALYARAAVTGPLRRGNSLPETAYRLDGRTIDPRHLAEYDRVCGFRFRDVLPATYLHVLAFPLQVELMVSREFPFPMVGMVHLANSITVHRPVTLEQTVSFIVRAEDLRDHPAGRQLDMICEARVGDELVWSGRSTYLRPGGKKQVPAKEGAKRPRSQPPAGATALVRVPGDIGRRYGAVSGDRNPIHLSGISAKLFGFRSAIAHGMWLKARTLASIEERLPERYTVDVAFKTPVFLPSTVSITSAREADGWALDVRNSRSGKPHLNGRVTPG